MPAGGSALAKEGGQKNSACLSPKMVQLKSDMQKAWIDHTIWTRSYIVSVMSNRPDAKDVLDRLLQNQQDIGNLIKPYYGEEAGNKLSELLREQIQIAGKIVAAAKTGNQADLKSLDADWHRNADDIAKFLSAANPNWPFKTIQDMFYTHLQLITELGNIEIDGVLGSSYVEEFLDHSRFSPFPQVQYTERPDVVSAALLEGRVAIIVDGTPMVLLAPVTLWMLLQSAEDYYQRYIAGTWIRWIRYLFVFISLLLPSVYVAITTFHPEMIPPKLLMTIAASREIVPFPALIEAFIMEISFEALREAAVRIPKSIGQAVSIIGALIIGTAAVQAGIVSAAMVIIVSFTGIASFIIPHFDLGLSIRLLRFPIMIFAGLFGLFGIICGLLLIYIHLINLRSFGMPYLAPMTPLIIGDLKDTYVRAPWWYLRKRPSTAGKNKIRQGSKKIQETEREEDGD